MIGRRVQGSSKRDQGVWRRVGEPLGRRRRSPPTVAAFLTGLAILGLGLWSLRAGVAAGLVERPGDRGDASSGGGFAGSNIVWTPVAPAASQAPRAIPNSIALVSTTPRRFVCVRLCDGYYFPTGPFSRDADFPDQEAACASLCPDAPTRLFVEAGGSDSIEDAVSGDGARYAALPTAFHNRARFDKSCACHRKVSVGLPLLEDFTLRNGDAVMTASGIMVFRGAGHAPFSQDDFTTLANAALPNDRRAVLATMERTAAPEVDRSNENSTAPGHSEIAFATPPAALSTPTARDNSIRFVEPPSASN